MEKAQDCEAGIPASADGPAFPATRGFAFRRSPVALSGSWVDVFSLADGRKGVVVGCCAEPANTGSLRSDARAALARTGDPTRCLEGMDGLAVSAVSAVIDATTICYGTHGHAASAVAVPDTRPPFGPEGVHSLTPGATVLLSTAPMPGAAALLGGGAALHPDQLADRVIGSAAGSAGVAAVLYRHPPGPMSITTPAAPANLAVSRGRLRDWLAEAGVDPETCADVLLAVGEATANATEHSVLGTDREVTLTVRAAWSGNMLQLSVSDDGSWKPAAASPGHRGHGIPLINALVDSVELTTTRGGTTVAMLKEVP